MKFEEMKEMSLDLSSLGGNRPYTLEEVVSEVVCGRRNCFFNQLFAKANNQKAFGGYRFDAIGFIAATKDFCTHVFESGFEGEVVYDVIAGVDWVWHCKTTITWMSSYPIVGGDLMYHTDVVPGENVDSHRIAAMTGTDMKIQIVKNNLKSFTYMDAIKRDGFIK